MSDTFEKEHEKAVERAVNLMAEDPPVETPPGFTHVGGDLYAVAANHPGKRGRGRPKGSKNKVKVVENANAS